MSSRAYCEAKGEPEKWKAHVEQQKTRYKEKKEDSEWWKARQRMQKEWWAGRMEDPAFRAKERQRKVEYRKRKKLEKDIKDLCASSLHG